MTGDGRPLSAVGNGTDLDDVAGLLHPAGRCSRCDEHAEHLVTIAIVPGNSGPGWSRTGCISCAKTLAAFMLAPDWLRTDVARLEAAGL